MPDKHGWNSWDQYLDIHTRHIQNYLGHFILDDQLTSTVTSKYVRWDGTLFCIDDIQIQVTKLQEVQYQRRQPMVRTTEYRYHVLRRTEHRTINLFRYDNSHTQAGHPDPHHKHRFDSAGNEIEPPEHVGEAGWPTLSEVIEEVHTFWSKQKESTDT